MTPPSAATARPERTTLQRATIRIAGDSGDGIQLTGTQFTLTTALAGNDLATLPDFPAEIRAPAGTLAGVSAFQIQFSSDDIHTPGDAPDVLVAMNAAALMKNLGDLKAGGMVLANADGFGAQDLKKAGLDTNPLDDGSVDAFVTHALPITELTEKALADSPLSANHKRRCKNFFALGVLFWLYDRDRGPTEQWIDQKFGRRPDLRDANLAALKAGHVYGQVTGLFQEHYQVPSASLPPGTYRNIMGNSALALGFVVAARKAGLQLFQGSYPITPASDILHHLAALRNHGVVTFQAEDEMAAVCAAIGAAYAGSLAITTTSGPGFALKAEAVGLAVMTELPLVVVDVQRGGPSTGLPTKTEQSDLLQALYGRNGECPAAVLAIRSPGDAFACAFEAARAAIESMCPVVLLSDGYVANGAEPWRIPDVAALPAIDPGFAAPSEDFLPYARDEETLRRPWALPGTPGLEHRIGGLEKQEETGNVSYDPDNHHRMTELRAQKIARIADRIGPATVAGAPEGDVLVVGWGSTWGAIWEAVSRLHGAGHAVGHLHLRWLNPFPKNLGELLGRYRRVLVPEINMGQLVRLLRAEFLIDARGYNRVRGQPFKAAEIEAAILAELEALS